MKKRKLLGNVASQGIAIGTVRVYKKRVPTPSTHTISTDCIEVEQERYHEAVAASRVQLCKLAKDSPLFAAYIDLLSDFALEDSVMHQISQQLQNAELALQITIDQFCAVFEAMEDEYMRERSADLKDVGERILRNLKGIQEDDTLTSIREPVIILTEDLTPSDTAQMDLDYVIGFVTQGGGVTSHVSIMARSLGLPAIVGAKDILSQVKDGETIVLDGLEGELILSPDEETLSQYRQLQKNWNAKQENLRKKAHKPAVTTDGCTIKVYGNAGSVADIHQAKACGADGIGLFRTEFIFMNSNHFPTEEEQFCIYQEAAQAINGEVIIRTLDIGGDKCLPYYSFELEENPFLGYRAIRICLDMPTMFKNQLRAILRASAFGTLAIMFPMIISQEELMESRRLLEKCKQELEQQGIPYDRNIRIGMMIETPASVILAEEFAALVDFFSIGTNDLTQYLLAVDRGNTKIAKSYDSFHPAVLRSIAKVIEAAHRQGIEVGMCGEFAADPSATKILLGMGLDEFSVAASSVPTLKQQICSYSMQCSKQVAEKIKVSANQADVTSALNLC